MPKPGVRMVGSRPERRQSQGPVLRIELGKAYTARKGSPLRWQFGHDAVYMVTQLPPVVYKSTIIQVLGPRGVAMVYAADLRPCEEVVLEEEGE